MHNSLLLGAGVRKLPQKVTSVAQFAENFLSVSPSKVSEKTINPGQSGANSHLIAMEIKQ